MNSLSLILNLFAGLAIGIVYSQIFCYQKSGSSLNLDNKKIKNKDNNIFNYKKYLLTNSLSSVARLVLLALVLYALLSWDDLNPILLIIPLLATFWFTVLKKAEII